MEQKDEVSKKKANQFSIKYKLMIIFSCLVTLSLSISMYIAITTAKGVVFNKVEDHLKDKAVDTSVNLDAVIQKRIYSLEVLARNLLQDVEVHRYESAKILETEAEFLNLVGMYYYNKRGMLYLAQNNKSIRNIDISDREYFKTTSNGKTYVTEVYFDRITGKPTMSIAVPVFDENKKIVGGLLADFNGLLLSDYVKNIVVGKTGTAYIVGLSGNTIADIDEEIVLKQDNNMEIAKTDKSYETIANFEQRALTEDKPAVDYFEWQETRYIASFAKIPTTGWAVIVYADAKEFIGAINDLKFRLILINIGMIICAIIVVLVVSNGIVKPIKVTVNTLKDIAEGEGDLTVRLPVKGNDEITDLSQYFNQTIEKIGKTIQTVKGNASELNDMGQALSTNMTETATSVNQISANIEGVKIQVMNQASGVTQTSATMEQIMRTIEQLNQSIERQAINVAESSSSIEEMVANIASVTQTLLKTDNEIKGLAGQTREGKDVINATANDMQNILEESGTLMEAASVIQNIASQTNLLAMNAAIEAAHAGDSGRGFAVVADEIRKLAEESSTQGKSISESLKNLSAMIHEIAESSKTVEEKFITIFEVARGIKEMSSNLTAIMHEQERGSKEIFLAIRDINTVTNEVKDGSAEMLKGGQQVATEMRKLSDLTRIITDSMNEMASGAIQINNAVQEVNNMSETNKESIQELTYEVNKFRV